MQAVDGAQAARGGDVVVRDRHQQGRDAVGVGAIDLVGCSKQYLPPHERDMAKRMMRAYEAMGCEASWTCSPYQAGHRPATGSDVAWGESNAVVFCNSVLGARTNRYGDFLDIAAAIAGREFFSTNSGSWLAAKSNFSTR